MIDLLIGILTGIFIGIGLVVLAKYTTFKYSIWRRKKNVAS